LIEKKCDFDLRKKRKEGKKGKKKEPVQTGIIVPRAALSEESVYGKIKIIERNKPVKYLFENPQLIFKPYIKALVEERIGRFSNDKKKALASLKKEPIYLDKEGTKLLEYGSCFKEEYVIKYPLGAGQRMLFDGKEDEEKALRVIHSIVDKSIAEIIQKRLYDKNKNFVKTNEAFRDLENNPVWYNKERRIAIRSVRCLTGLSVLEAIETTDKRNQVLYEKFIKTGNNHHIAFYKDRS
jgi:CRISPR-associated endonuclease Csn1